MREKTASPSSAPIRRSGLPFLTVGLCAAGIAAMVFVVSIRSSWSRENSTTAAIFAFFATFFPALMLVEFLMNRRQEKLALLYVAAGAALKRSSASLHGRGVIKNTQAAEAHYQTAIAGFKRVASESTSAELCRSCASSLEALVAGFVVDPATKFADLGFVGSTYLRAALLGSKNAQFKVAILHQEGVGLPRDHVEAYAWYNICAATGSLDAARCRELLASGLTPAEVSQAQRRSQELQVILSGQS